MLRGRILSSSVAHTENWNTLLAETEYMWWYLYEDILSAFHSSHYSGQVIPLVFAREIFQFLCHVSPHASLESFPRSHCLSLSKIILLGVHASRCMLLDNPYSRGTSWSWHHHLSLTQKLWQALGGAFAKFSVILLYFRPKSNTGLNASMLLIHLIEQVSSATLWIDKNQCLEKSSQFLSRLLDHQMMAHTRDTHSMHDVDRKKLNIISR